MGGTDDDDDDDGCAVGEREGGSSSSDLPTQPPALSHFLHCIPEHDDATADADDPSRPDGIGGEEEDGDDDDGADGRVAAPTPSTSATTSSTSSSRSSSWLRRRCHLTPSYALGLSFLLVVALIWSLASVLVQELYTEYDFHSPFVLTYLCTSLFVVLLPSRLIAERLLPRFLLTTSKICGGGKAGRSERMMPVIPWNSEGVDRGYTDVASFDRDEHGHDHELAFEHNDDVDDGAGAGGSASASAGAIDDHDDAEEGRGGGRRHQRQSRHRPMGDGEGDGSNLPDASSASERNGSDRRGHGDELGTDEQQPLRRGQLNGGRGAPQGRQRPQQQRQQSPPSPDRGRGRFNHDRGIIGHDDDEDEATPLGHVQHIKMASYICPVWFLSNFAYNYSLAYTSIASSTVLASTGSLFTFLFAVWCGDECCNVAKFAGVALCVVGGVLTSIADANSSGDPSGGVTGATSAADDDGGDSSADGAGGEGGSAASSPTARAIGDLAGLISAIGYGAYTVLIRTQCPRDESRMSMQLLFGYIGLLNMIFLLPLVLLTVFVTGSVDVANLTWTVFGWIVVKGLLDNVLSDYLWARAVVLTSATVATVGLGLTIPLAFVSDFVLGRGMGGGDGGGGGPFSPENLVGALGVLLGFILVNVGSGKERQ